MHMKPQLTIQVSTLSLGWVKADLQTRQRKLITPISLFLLCLLTRSPKFNLGIWPPDRGQQYPAMLQLSMVIRWSSKVEMMCASSRSHSFKEAVCAFHFLFLFSCGLESGCGSDETTLTIQKRILSWGMAEPQGRGNNGPGWHRTEQSTYLEQPVHSY